ncbi:Aspartate kinase [bioreactor metagenome]|uniref:aspartate kinase n=1 Tax=bioreactor metagenome TaxID=1076179 RepID=A0A645BDQ7_9ZZZZ
MEEKSFAIRGVTHDADIAKIAILGVPDRPGIAFKVFSVLAKANIDVDMIVQSMRNNNDNIIDLVFTVAKTDLPKAKTIVSEVGQEIEILGIVADENVAKVSIVGAGMYGYPGIAAEMFGALAGADVNIEVISTSEISVSCLIQADKVKAAVNAIHSRFFPEM